MPKMNSARGPGSVREVPAKCLESAQNENTEKKVFDQRSFSSTNPGILSGCLGLCLPRVAYRIPARAKRHGLRQQQAGAAGRSWQPHNRGSKPAPKRASSSTAAVLGASPS